MAHQRRVQPADSGKLPDCIKVLDLDGRVEFMSDGGFGVMEVEAFDMLRHQHWPELWPEAERHKVITAIQIAQSGATGRFQGFAPTMKGNPRWWDVVVTAINGADLRPEKLLSVSRDITTGRAAEEQLRESEARFRLMADAVPQIVWITDAGGHTEFFNKQWSNYTGAAYEPTTAGQIAHSFIHPDDAGATMAAFDKARATGTNFDVEHRIRSAAGEYRWFLVRGEPYYDQDGAIIRWFGASVDIHDRKLAEDRLRELNDTLEQQVAARSAERDRLWNLSEDMLARADYQGRMSAASPAWSNVVGWSEEELLRRGYAEFMHPDDAAATLAAIERIAATRTSARFENRIATVDGGWKPIEWTVVPEADGVNFIAVGRDLSNAKAREAELAAAQEALRQSQKMEAMGSLTGGVAHDFNNLLTPIIGSLDMLHRKGVGSERERRLIDGALQSAERAKTLVQRLLAFARRQPLQAVAVDVAQLVSGMTDLIGSTLGPAIDLRVAIDPGLAPARADPNQVEMALLNLAVNARDAMPDGGELRIAVGRANVREPDRTGLPRGHYVRLAVTDTGSGMDAETLSRAIEPFFSTKGIGKGTGLGLSMVHGLAAQLGGGLTITSAPDRGTTVELWLPISTVAAEGESPAPEPTVGPKHLGTALLVDDEDLVRMTTADMLSDLGYTVVEAGSAEQALRLVGEGLYPDLLVTDHLMPGMNGAMLARTLHERRPDLPVLIVSGYAEADGMRSDIARLTKPFRQTELAASLSALTGS
ncbi:PAS domain S-box protein [Sphingomonas sp. LR60]|uniref:PAS domain S-box protein n=1 Tax=Sphingomonas sp. LR60 TaxID=3050233 RepID=UPI002FE1AD10